MSAALEPLKGEALSSRQEYLTARFDLRTTPQEKQELKAQADAAGLSLSAYCRRLLLGRRVIHYQARLDRNELRRLFGFTKQLHLESQGAYSEQTAEILRLIEKHLKALGE